MPNDPIRVAYIDQTGQIGGSEQLLLTLIQVLPREKVSPLIICPQEGPLSAEARRLNIPIQVLPLPHFYSFSYVLNQRKILNPFAVILNIVNLTHAAFILRRYLKSCDIDLVQTTATFAHIYGGLAARLSGIPCIWYFIDLIEHRRLGGSFAIAWKILAYFLPTHIVAVAKVVLASMPKFAYSSVIYPALKEVPEPADSPSLHLLLSLPDNAKFVGFIGRIAYTKGLDILVQAAQQVIRINPNVHFIIFGDAIFGETNYKQALIRATERAGLQGNWHWMGHDPLARARIFEFDIMVAPSRRETFGLVIAEAGWARKAVIASHVGGIPEVIIENKTGLLFPSENPQALAQAILSLIDNPQLANDLGQRAREYIETTFTLSQLKDSFLRLYDVLLQT